MDDRWLFLDFDGVICNSLEECYQSSWLAWKGLVPHAELPPPAPEDHDWRAAFVACRPFVRSGEDYLVVQDLVDRALNSGGPLPRTQADFDRELAERGPERLARFKTALYAVRTGLLGHHPWLWASWNPLYPGMADILSGLSSQPRAAILSTKQARYVLAILAHNGVDWPAGRCHEASGSSKLAIIDALLAQQGSTGATTRAVLVDDQVDHLDFGLSHVECRLAGWGFVSGSADVPPGRELNLEKGLALMKAWLPEGA